MASRIGIIPAAGKAARFGGVLKELLPAKDGKSFLWHAISRLPVDLVVVVTNQEKIAQHAKDLGGDALYVIQTNTNDIWGAMLAGMSIDADYYYFTMPDTFLPPGAFMDVPNADFALGVFRTDTPERYGVLTEAGVINKRAGLPTPAWAWGALVWSREVRDFWEEALPENYTHAINLAMARFGYETWELAYYHDNASIADYLRYMHND